MLGKYFYAVSVSALLLFASVTLTQARLPSAIAKKVNPSGITTKTDLNYKHCTNKGVHCVRFFDDVTNYDVSALKKNNGHAKCSQVAQSVLSSQTPDKEVNTGLCLTKHAGSFVIDCQTTDAAYVVVEFDDNRSSFKAYGGAKAVLDHFKSKSASGLVTSAVMKKPGVDITVDCPAKPQ